jgi:hypothetical protein
MAAKKPNIQILDILRRTPGVRIQELAKKVKNEPEIVLNILNDPDFQAYLKNTETAHLSQLRSLHQIAFDRIAEVLESHKDIKKVEDLAKWLLNYTTDSILKVSEMSGEANEGSGQITINQVMGRDPFAKKT